MTARQPFEMRQLNQAWKFLFLVLGISCLWYPIFFFQMPSPSLCSTEVKILDLRLFQDKLSLLR